MRAASGATWLTGFALLIFVYYAGGALTTPTQSWGMALGVGLAVILLSWLLYDALWTLLVGRQAVAAVLSILLLGAIAQGLAEFMTGRAVFIHLGALLGTIMVNNTQQRPQRVAHNAVLAPAVIILMISNHFPAHLRGYARLAGGADRRFGRVPDGHVVRMDVEARATSSGCRVTPGYESVRGSYATD